MSGEQLCTGAHRSRGAGGRWPTQPTIIRTGPQKPLQFTDVDALARHIHRQRGRRGLRLSRTVGQYDGSDTFTCFKVWWVYDETCGGHEEYAFAAAIQSDEQATLEAAIAAANPDTPSEAPRGAYCA